jgi:hypothetical protein
MTPHDELFAADFQVVVHHDDGVQAPFNMEGRKYFRGAIAGRENTSRAILRVASDGSCFGTITSGDDMCAGRRGKARLGGP